VNVTDRGTNSITLAFSASELLVIVNALQGALVAADAEVAQVCRQVQRPLVDALQYLRPKSHLSDGRWVTDWTRGSDGKHL